MNCHGNHGNKEHDNRAHKIHMLLMIICCLLPIGLIAIFSVLTMNNATLGRILPYAAFLLCPLMHLAMIPMMFRKEKARVRK